MAAGLQHRLSTASSATSGSPARSLAATSLVAFGDAQQTKTAG